MKTCLLLAALTVFACVRPGTAKAQSGAQSPDTGKDVLNVFAAKCAVCHGPELAKPKGRFGYVLDSTYCREPEWLFRHTRTSRNCGCRPAR